jgi:hypothetical protein
MVIVDGLNGTIKQAIEELQGLAATGVGGATTFLGLTDTPSSYSGHGGKFVTVSGTENALVFTSSAGMTSDQTDMLDLAYLRSIYYLINK